MAIKRTYTNKRGTYVKDNSRFSARQKERQLKRTNRREKQRLKNDLYKTTQRQQTIREVGNALAKNIGVTGANVVSGRTLANYAKTSANQINNALVNGGNQQDTTTNLETEDSVKKGKNATPFSQDD